MPFADLKGVLGGGGGVPQLKLILVHGAGVVNWRSPTSPNPIVPTPHPWKMAQEGAALVTSVTVPAQRRV